MMAAEFSGDEGDKEKMKRMNQFLGPGQVDHRIRQAFQMCWMALPPERKNLDEVEKEVRRIFERAVRDFREDNEHFGHLT